MIIDSRCQWNKSGTTYKFQFGVMRGKQKRWLSRGQVPEDAVEEYRKYVADGKGTRGWMSIVAEIEEQTEKLKKLGRLPVESKPRPGALIQETTSPIANSQVVAKKRQVLKIQENKKIHYDTRKRLEKKKRLEILRSDYSNQPKKPLEESNN